jgi:hypothetical protein
MSFVLKHALEFNKFTVGLAAAGLAYVGSFFGSESSVAREPSTCLRLISTTALLFFATSVLCGIFVMGRATKLAQAADNEKVDDDVMKRWGVFHSATLCIGLIVAAVLMLNKIWNWFA